nr:hypothetical protein [Candidatus Gracilibacteria bacterium]
MRINTKAYSLIELIIALALFAQMMIMLSSAVFMAIEIHTFNQANQNTRLELYKTITHTLAPYIRRASGIAYANEELNNAKIGTISQELPFSGIQDSELEHYCQKNSRLTLYQDPQYQIANSISFALEKDAQNKT